MKHNPSKQSKAIEPEFISVDQAEALSGVSRWTWRRMAYDRRIASTKVGKLLRIPVAEVRRVLEAGLRPAAQVIEQRKREGAAAYEAMERQG